MQSPLTASVLAALFQAGQLPHPSWDLAKCRQSLTDEVAQAGHLCTPEHLEMDAAQLAKDQDIREDIRSSPQLLYESAETGIVEVVAMLKKGAADLAASREATVRWTDGSSYSKAFLSAGHTVRLIVTESLAVLAFIESTDDPLRIQMYFVNKSQRPFDVIPDNFTLAVVEPKANVRPLPYLSPKQVVKKIENEAAWQMIAEAISSASRAIAGATTTATSATVTAWDARGKSAYGTYNGITKTYDNAANQQQTAATMARISDASEAQMLRQTTGAVLPNTVFPGQEYGGVVHFKREKRAQLMILRVPVGGQTFEFPLEMPKK
jgi:hypothetical protein